MANKNFMGEVAGGFATTTRNVSNINAANTSAVLADTKANHAALSATDPGLEKVKNAKGFGNKVKTMGENLKDGMNEQTELNRQHREYVQSQEAYRELLEDMREDRQATINGTKYGRGAAASRNYSEEVKVIVPLAAAQIVDVDF